MSSTLGHDAPIGSKAREGEIGDAESNELETLEQERKQAVSRLNRARTEYTEASGDLLRIDQQIIRAQQSAMEAAITAARTITRGEVEAALVNAARDIEAATGVVVEVGSRSGWGELEPALEKARARTTGDQLSAVIAIKPLDQVSSQRPPGVMIALDVSGRLPEPNDTRTASELARRRGSRL